jgi:hypothetical protein
MNKYFKLKNVKSLSINFFSAKTKNKPIYWIGRPSSFAYLSHLYTQKLTLPKKTKQMKFKKQVIAYVFVCLQEECESKFDLIVHICIFESTLLCKN